MLSPVLKALAAAALALGLLQPVLGQQGNAFVVPSGVRLNLPMSPHLEELFRVQGLPTD